MHAMLKIQSIHFKKTGFTLIELLVVVAITSIVVGGSIAGFTKFYERQQVLTAAQEVRQLFVSAKTKAQVQETPSVCDSANPLQGYQVAQEESFLKVQPLCGINTTLATVPAYTETYSSYELRDGLSVTGTLPIKFFTLNNGVSHSSEQTITVNRGSVSHSFKISTGGAISDVQ